MAHHDEEEKAIILRRLGIEEDVILKFFQLIKEKIPFVHKAIYVIEHDMNVSAMNVAITNERDVLSHFATILTDDELNYQGRMEQLSTAEEHLRRAVIETYQMRFKLKMAKTIPFLEKYKKEVLLLAIKGVRSLLLVFLFVSKLNFFIILHLQLSQPYGLLLNIEV